MALSNPNSEAMKQSPKEALAETLRGQLHEVFA